MSSLPVIQQLKTTLRLAVTLTLWRASTVMASSVGPKRFVITSTSDALRLARAAFRVGTIIDAVVVGSVEVVKPIQIGNFTRLTLKGRGAGAQLTYSLDKGSASSATPDFERLPCATDRNELGLFDVGGNASLVVDNLSIFQQDTSCAGPAALIKLHSHGLIDAKGCTFRMSIRSASSDSGDGIGSRQSSPLTIFARRGSIIRISPSEQHGEKAVSAIESGRGSESVPSSSLLVVLEEGAEVVTWENGGEGNRFDRGTDDASWLALDASWKTRVFPLTSDALYLWVHSSPDIMESSAPTWWSQADFLRARSAKGEGEDDNAAAMAFRTPFTHWEKHTVLDNDRLQVEGSFYIGKTEVWDDSGDGDDDDPAEQGRWVRWEKARGEGYAGNSWIGEKVRIGADIEAKIKIEIAHKREMMDGDFQRQLDNYSCPEGYRGASCTDCASGFTMGPGGACARTEVQCTAWTEFGGGLLAAFGLSIFLLALDAVRNGKSPTHRLAQIWQKATGCCRRGGMFCQDIGTPILTPKEVAEPRTARRGLDGKNGFYTGHGTLARLLYGCITFIVTAQIITQSTKVLELELSSAMEEVVAGLDWANMDPLLVPVTCSSVRGTFPSFPDRVVGTVGLLTACLAVLAFSQTTIAMCGGSPEVNEQHAPTRRSSMRQFDIDAAVGDGEIHPSRAPRAIQRANGEHPDEMSSAGMRLEGLQDRGAWEQWESWDSSERHAFAAILVCFLMHPVVCTMLLGVFDCRSIDGDDALWLRTDLSIECLSQHQTYLVVAVVFLGLYGIGIPLALLAIVFWAKTSAHDDDRDDKLSAGNENNMVGSTSTAESYVVPLASRGLADSSAEAENFAAASLSATVSAQGEEGDFAAAAEARSTTRDASRQRYPGVVGIRRYQSSTNEETGMDRSAQVGGSGSKLGFMIAFREETDVELGIKHHLTSTSLDGKGEGETTRQAREHFPGNSSWQDACLSRGDSDHAGWRVTERGNPILVSNTSVTPPNDQKSYVARAWNLSGHCVLSVGMAISSTTGLSTSSPKEDINQLGKRWRCTIPLWWPYRTNRRWFAAWDLLRRTLLTGLLTLVPVDEGGVERVTVACAIAGLSLVVAEVARPHRDPWIGWIYRMGGVMVLLVDMLGVLQQVSSAGSATPSVATMTVSVIFLLFLPLMLLCICCGWRLSCAEQREGTFTAAAAIPWPESASYRRHSSGGGGGTVNSPDRGDNDNDSDQVKRSSNLPSNVHVLRNKEGPLSGDESGPRDLRSATNSESGLGESRTPQNTPSGRRILSSDSEHLSNSSRRSVSQPSTKQLSQLFTVSSSLHNPMHSNSSGTSERLSETARSDSSSRVSTHSCSIGLQMHSQSPAPMAGTSIKRGGFGFNSTSGEVSSTVRVPVEAHQMASGRAFHSNCGKERATCAQVISLSDLDANEIGVNPPTLTTRARSCSSSSGLDGFADDSNMARRLLNIGAKAAEGRVTAPIIAPGAPSIDGHKSRLARNARPTRSSSSFISTSFESSTTGERSRKGSASRGRGGLRRSASSGGFFNGSRSQSGSHSGDVSRSPGVGCSSAGCALNSPDPFEETNIRVGFRRGRPSVIKKISTTSGSFMSSGSSTMGINSWVNPVVRPPALRSLRTKSSQDLEMYGSPCSLDSGFGSEGISEAVKVSSRVARGLTGSPVNQFVLSEVSALSRWINHEHGGDASFAEEGGLGSVTAADIVAATVEQKAPVGSVEAVFGEDIHHTEHRSSIPEGGRNVAQFPTLFIQEGASGTSSYKSRIPEGSGSGGCIDAEDAENATRKPCPSIARSASDQRYWEGDASKTPLSSFALKQYIKQHEDFDSEDYPFDFSRVVDRANTIKANVAKADAKMDG